VAPWHANIANREKSTAPRKKCLIKKNNRILPNNPKLPEKDKRIVEVVPHDPNWKQKFKEEANKIKKIFKRIFVDIHHIGSTAIPLFKAKPIIDIMVEAKDINKVDSCNKQIEELGYVALGEYGIPKRRFFQKGGNNRTHHIHIFEKGSPQIKRHLDFRDYLISNPKVAGEYSRLKENLAKKYRYDIDKYQKGKKSFIKKINKLLNNK
jgi:GrpB-like predicted nucleotidyltransferase (UPF0157 family)